jgi:hypothetical protein
MMPIARRLLAAANDARMVGHKPVKARISPSDMAELKIWLRRQNHPISTGMPPQQLSIDKLYDMTIVEDAKVHEVIVLEMAK